MHDAAPSARLLVVDDDPINRRLLASYLERLGHTVVTAVDGARGWKQLHTGDPFDVVLLDVLMPELDGYEVLALIRGDPDLRHLPVIMISAVEETDSIARCIELGADDYLPKPFALEELLARLRALLRRAASDAEEPAGAVLRFADLELDPGTRDVRRGDRPISLTRTEFALLELFLAHPKQVLTRGRILEDVWGYDFPTSGNALEVYVGYLRRKTEAEGEPRLLHTVRGVGYVLRETPP